MSFVFSPAWQRYFAGAASPTTPPAGAEAGATSAPLRPTAGAVPPSRPRPVDQRPTSPEPRRRALELAWLTWQMPERLRNDARLNLHQTLGWRAQYCAPLDESKTPPGYARFGLQGEVLWPHGAQSVLKMLREELRETIREVEAGQPRLERNRVLAMRGARLGQLCVELEQRGIDALEELRSGLTWLWE